jgi:hypothetical protein
MANAHKIAIEAALKTNDELQTLFEKLGTADAPRGRVLAAYRMARRALSGNVSSLAVVLDTLNELRATVQSVVTDILHSAVEIGATQARRELRAYGLGDTQASVGAVEQQAALEAVLASLDAQIAKVRALALMGNADEAVVLGGDTHAGILSPGVVNSEASKWIGVLSGAAWLASVQHATRGGGEQEFRRQAIAAVDERTTETCLLINGTVVGMDEPFPLQGEPWNSAKRYGFSAMALPFHWY